MVRPRRGDEGAVQVAVPRRGPAGLHLGPEGGEVGLRVGVRRRVDVPVGLRPGVVERRHVLAGHVLAEPAALDRGQVPDQAEQGQVGGRDRPQPQLLGVEPGALPQQRLAVEVEEAFEQARSSPAYGGSVRSSGGAVLRRGRHAGDA